MNKKLCLECFCINYPGTRTMYRTLSRNKCSTVCYWCIWRWRREEAAGWNIEGAAEWRKEEAAGWNFEGAAEWRKEEAAGWNFEGAAEQRREEAAGWRKEEAANCSTFRRNEGVQL